MQKKYIVWIIIVIIINVIILSGVYFFKAGNDKYKTDIDKSTNLAKQGIDDIRQLKEQNNKLRKLNIDLSSDYTKLTKRYNELQTEYNKFKFGIGQIGSDNTEIRRELIKSLEFNSQVIKRFEK